MPILLFFISLFIIFSAQAGDFSRDAQWLALLHYQPQLTGAEESTIDSPDFFLSPNGKYDSSAELQATIDLFENSGDIKKKCLFPARYKCLKEQGLIHKEFPDCPEWQSFYDDIRPSGATLLFTNAYMNNPASLFGHTLLRIDTARKGTQLLAHGANYGAFTGEENGILFAVLGLTGGYYGGFTVKPYYDIINQYNNIENRDIWELNLNLSPDELDMLMAHLWELGQTRSRYYFFSENCSYMLLETLDAVRPELRLATQFPVQVIPLDTLKAVNSRAGLVKNINYRPSRQNKILHRFKQMDAGQRRVYHNIIKKQKFAYEDLTDAEKAGVLETAYQYVQYQYVAEKLELKDYRKQSFAILKERNRITANDSISELTEGKNPLLSHASSRISFGAGVRNGGGFQQFSARPAYTSLLDNSYGLLSGAEINFLDLTARHYDRGNKLVLQNLDIIGIRSLSPIDSMFTPVSYNVLFNIGREMNPETEDEGYVLHLQAGGGGAYALSERLTAYMMINNHIAYGGFLPHNSWAGIGPEVGIYGDFDNWRLLASAEKVFATSSFADKIKYKTGLSFDISKNTSLTLQYNFNDNHGHDEEETLLNFQLFY